MLSRKLEKAKHMAAGLRAADDLFAFKIFVFLPLWWETSTQEYLLKVRARCSPCIPWFPSNLSHTFQHQPKQDLSGCLSQTPCRFICLFVISLSPAEPQTVSASGFWCSPATPTTHWLQLILGLVARRKPLASYIILVHLLDSCQIGQLNVLTSAADLSSITHLHSSVSRCYNKASEAGSAFVKKRDLFSSHWEVQSMAPASTTSRHGRWHPGGSTWARERSHIEEGSQGTTGASFVLL